LILENSRWRIKELCHFRSVSFLIIQVRNRSNTRTKELKSRTEKQNDGRSVETARQQKRKSFSEEKQFKKQAHMN
jgi:hypothetical protein